MILTNKSYNNQHRFLSTSPQLHTLQNLIKTRFQTLKMEGMIMFFLLVRSGSSFFRYLTLMLELLLSPIKA